MFILNNYLNTEFSSLLIIVKFPNSFIKIKQKYKVLISKFQEENQIVSLALNFSPKFHTVSLSLSVWSPLLSQTSDLIYYFETQRMCQFNNITMNSMTYNQRIWYYRLLLAPDVTNQRVCTCVKLPYNSIRSDIQIIYI